MRGGAAGKDGCADPVLRVNIAMRCRAIVVPGLGAVVGAWGSPGSRSSSSIYTLNIY